MTNHAKIAAFITVLLLGHAVECLAAQSEPSATVVELESPLAKPLPLQGYLRQTNSAGPSPAVVLLHGCSGNWQRLDQRWGKRVAAWGYVTLTVDSFGPRGLENTCNGGSPVDLAFDAYRALNFLAGQPFVDPARVAVLGFAQGGWLALTSVEHGAIEKTSKHKFRAAIAFYPPCIAFKGNMTVPTLILIGERDDWTPAQACRNMVEGREDFGISREKGLGVPIQLIVYPDAYHAFDVSGLETPIQHYWHHLEFNRAATDKSIQALREFLADMIGERASPVTVKPGISER